MFRPRREVFLPNDEVVVCRCEEITAGRIREIAHRLPAGPNQTKAFTRAGMGPCQGRQCGYTITRLLAEATGRKPADIGFYRARPPLKPVTVAELATLS
jgi:bacterioferritin-associated ferredoxin